MLITIAERLRPFSHLAGTRCLVPGTCCIAEVFPARVHIWQGGKLVDEYRLEVVGAVKQFTVQLDLEKGCIRVFGQGKNGFFRYRIQAGGKGVCFKVEKGELALPEDPPMELVLPKERLSLGSHKKQHWEKVAARCDLKEILPVWHRLALMSPQVQNGLQLKSYEEFQNLFLAGFSGIFAPRLFDETYQGIALPEASSPMEYVQAGRCAGSLFASVEGRQILLLPNLFPEFHAGRLISAPLSGIGELDLEWSKKKVRRAILRANENCSVSLILRGGLKTFRLNKKSVINANSFFDVEAGRCYYFDRFA